MKGRFVVLEFAAPGGEVNDVFCSVPGSECGSRSMAVHSGFAREIAHLRWTYPPSTLDARGCAPSVRESTLPITGF